MNNKYYLRIEGVNLSNFVYDTQDLSTTRGGGLLLLNSIEELKSIKELKAKFEDKLDPISTGASSGLFEVKVSGFDEVKEVKSLIESHIRKDNYLKHATFVIDILKSDGSNFKRDNETLIALNRWKQMQSQSVAVPSPSQSSDKPCRIDMVRPAMKPIRYKDEGYKRVSESIYYRRKYGLGMKKDFYKKFINIKPKIVKDLEELTDIDNSSPLRKESSIYNLNRKMAVIYIDGNGFGAIQAKKIKEQEELKSWDSTIKCRRWDMFSKLLNEIKDKPEWQNNGKLRFETLLWGGDELIWVVPAWVGWQTLSFFYQHTKDESNNWIFNGEHLNHAAGIVFCHHNAPIHRITGLAKYKLAELAKENRDKSLFVYQQLESFDHIGKSIQDYNFDTYCGELKFSVNLEFQTELDRKVFDDRLRKEFADNNITLAGSAEASVKKLGDTWRIHDYEELLFSVNLEFKNSLDERIISDELRQEFKDKNNLLTQDAILTKEIDNKWQIDNKSQTYIIRKDKDKLNIYHSKHLYFIKKDEDKDKLNVYEPYNLVLDGEKMSDIEEKIIKLKKNDFSNSLLHKIAKYVVSGKDKDNIDALIKESIEDVDDQSKKLLQDLKILLNGEYAKWIHIAELWDYIV